MKNLIVYLTVIFNFSSFGFDGKLHEFVQCKKEMKELREAHASHVAYGGEYFLNSAFFRDISRIPDIIYFGQKTFNFRPWLKEVTLEKKLEACVEAREKLRPSFGEPRGVDSVIRPDVEEVSYGSNSNYSHQSVGASSR